LKVHYAHGGGYTELGGVERFLRKINSEVEYERLFPAKRPMKKPVYMNKDREERRNKESGVTGKSLFRELLRRLEKKKLDNEEVGVLVIVDDTDCRLSDEVARKEFYASVDNFENKARKIFKNLKIIFIWAEPEIERWFCIDRANCFKDRRCKDKNLFRRIEELLEVPFVYSEEKGSCIEKFSDKFKEILEECGIYYSKKNDGPELLKRVDPTKLEREDKFSAEGIKELKNLSAGGGNG